MTGPVLDATRWPYARDERIELDGRDVRMLRCDGPQDGAQSTPHLLLHGLGASAITWVEVLPGLARTGPVIAVDLPGFGHTAPGDDDRLTIDGYVQFVIDLLDTLGLPRVVLHGNSMGGLIGVLLAARHPDRVERLVLVSPALPPRSPLRLLVPSTATVRGMLPVAASSATAGALSIVGAGALLDERRSRDLLRLIYADPAGVRPELIDLMAAEYADDDAAHRRRALVQALLSIARLWADPRRVWAAIDHVTAPTLVLGGIADALVPAHVLRQVLARRRDWRGHVLDDRRHALMLESPEEYLTLVGSWTAPVPHAV